MKLSISDDVRMFLYDTVVDRGIPPTSVEIGDHFGLAPDKARELLGSIHIGKTLLTHPSTGEIWMAGPFSAVETQYRVIGKRATWWANCAWDMFGVAMIVGEPVRIDTHCTDCGEHWTLSADPESPPDQQGIVHFLLPARQWYEDIGFT